MATYGCLQRYKRGKSVAVQTLCASIVDSETLCNGRRGNISLSLINRKIEVDISIVCLTAVSSLNNWGSSVTVSTNNSLKFNQVLYCFILYGVFVILSTPGHYDVCQICCVLSVSSLFLSCLFPLSTAPSNNTSEFLAHCYPFQGYIFIKSTLPVSPLLCTND